MDCKDCVWNWFNEDVRREECNCPEYITPPCEEGYVNDDEDEYDDYYDDEWIEEGFDPYVGSYTNDC